MTADVLPMPQRPAPEELRTTDPEVAYRIAAARDWLDAAIAGRCSPTDATAAARKLCDAADSFVR